jgi:hypothetical protein
MAVNRSRKARAARRREHRMNRVDHDLSDEQWAELVGSDDLSVGGSAEVRECSGTQAVTGTWTSQRR